MGLFRRASEPVSQSQNQSPQETPLSTAAREMAQSQAVQAQARAAQGADSEARSGDARGGEAELQQLREEIFEMHRIISEVADRGSAQEKVFDVLHSELQDYKNDFIYEHLKPVLWPLLFLFDSLEQYAREIVAQVGQSGAPQLEAREVLDHLKFFRGQLVESLRICEVTPMKQPSGSLDPKHHKGIGVETVDDPADENTIRRVVRTGWFLNGKVLRHAEVIIGKRADAIRNTSTSNNAAPRVATHVESSPPVRASSDASASSGGRGS